MFDQPYPFRSGPRIPEPQPSGYLRVYTYVFHTENGPYVVRLEELISSFFAVKFYPKRLKHSPKKYSQLTRYGNASRVLATCLHVMLDMRRKVPPASFGFQGASLLGEGIQGTKRYRIYKRIFQTFFSPAEFRHLDYPSQSMYLILSNRQLMAQANLLELLEQHLVRHFYIDGK